MDPKDSIKFQIAGQLRDLNERIQVIGEPIGAWELMVK